MAQRVAPDCGSAAPQYEKLGTHNFINHQPSSISTVYADANGVLFGGDAQAGLQYNGIANHPDPWKIIQKMSDDNRALIEQIARLTTQITHLQSIVYQKQSNNSTVTTQDTLNSQLNPVTTMSVIAHNSSKRVLSPMSDEQRESTEMDNDPGTRIVSNAQRKRRAVGVSPSNKMQDNGLFISNQARHSKNIQQQSMNYANIQLQNNFSVNNNTKEQQELHISEEAKRFAQTRYPFSPFVVVTEQDIRDNLVVEDLCKFAKDKHQFNIDIAGYRRTSTNSAHGEYKILLFVKNLETFVLLLDEKVWPQELCGLKYKYTCPSIPPQLSVIIPDVPLNINFQEFSDEIRTVNKNIVSVIRLRNSAQQDIKAVKLEFNSVISRKEMLDKKRVLIMGLSLDIVEYLAQAHVLICSQCMNIGHFRKNCTQKDTQTCTVCGEKTSDIRLHKANCSGIMKCIHCNGPHKSNDTKCPIIKEYRAALTRSLLTHQQPTSSTTNTYHFNSENFPNIRMGWNTASQTKAVDLEYKWRTVVDEMLVFKSEIKTVVLELCDLILNDVLPEDSDRNLDYTKKGEEKHTLLRNWLKKWKSSTQLQHESI
ncbi:unnamed protein product [Rotaria socialis]|uniref:Uncharacterized protein n=1 Tax=Rotaria socialis TaxID=392032 RepID=A0A820XUX6_9BILA|nr:unnamed protein product [Rotaria socialis]CAF4538825.1 unnamed protein product [Rotaria socialis]